MHSIKNIQFDLTEAFPDTKIFMREVYLGNTVNRLKTSIMADGAFLFLPNLERRKMNIWSSGFVEEEGSYFHEEFRMDNNFLKYFKGGIISDNFEEVILKILNDIFNTSKIEVIRKISFPTGDNQIGLL